jgi:GT2 family glycosyltransferase
VIAVVVVNWNDEQTSVRALQSVRASDPTLPILVDNASTIDPTTLVKATVPNICVERMAANAGYAAACNRGVEVAMAIGAEHVLLMNNDAELLPDALDRLVAVDRVRPGRILAPLIVYRDAPEEVWSAGGYLERPYVRNHHLGLGTAASGHRLPQRVEWATGCALFFSIATWQRVGPLDEKFFLYLEDVDWCLRAAAAGVETWLEPDAVVRHEVSLTTGALSSSTIRYYAYRNHFRLAFRHSHGWRRAIIGFEVFFTLAKIGVRSVASSYRHDDWYQARTRAVRDFLLNRWGPEPTLTSDIEVVS